MKGHILLVPAWQSGLGTGHLGRMVMLTRDLRGKGRQAWLYLEEKAGDFDAFFALMKFDPKWRITEKGLENINEKPDCVVLDRFQTPKEEFLRYRELAPIVGIDEGGPCRDAFDFLVDILVPQNFGYSPPNIASPSFLQFFPRQKTPVCCENNDNCGNTSGGRKPVKVLVSFGREDTAGLGLAAAEALSAKNSGSLDITLLGGGMGNSSFSKIPNPETRANFRYIENIPNLGSRLSEYDLVITHYGITAYEALYSGTPVLLVSPGGYHEKIARAAGFYSAGLGGRGAAKLGRLLFNSRGNGVNYPFLQSLQKHCASLTQRHGLDKEPLQNLAALINGFSVAVNKNCPICGNAAFGRVLWRFTERTYRRCLRCRGIYMDRLNPPPIEYEREYFFDFYKKQYGKTYIEDFPNLVNMAKRRLLVIKSLLPGGGDANRHANERGLLDIGCAYGPFLAAAREEGFSPVGIDPAQDAVNYVQQTLGIPAFAGYFPGCKTAGSYNDASFDAVTLWFVMEHFRDCVPVFSEIKKLLKPGGILAFSTPSFSGVSGRFSLKRFLLNSPQDHRTIWSPGMCRNALEYSGFSVKKIVVCGHHPGRFPFAGKFAKGKKNPLYWLLFSFSKIFSLGDTFEIYAVVDANPPAQQAAHTVQKEKL